MHPVNLGRVRVWLLRLPSPGWRRLPFAVKLAKITLALRAGTKLLVAHGVPYRSQRNQRQTSPRRLPLVFTHNA